MARLCTTGDWTTGAIRRIAFSSAPTLQHATSAVIDAKLKAGCRPLYIKSLRQYLQQFIKGREKTKISDIKVEHLDAWFTTRKEALVSMASNYGRLSAMFSFAIRRGWITDNPVKRLERVRVEQRTPTILTPAQAKSLLEAAPANCVPFLALAMFAGIRPDEINYIQWADIDLVRGTVMINHSKTRRRRLVPMEANCIAWLNESPTRIGKVCPSQASLKRMRISLRSVLPKWEQDVLRHSAASYLIAIHKDAGKVATILGNSTAILLKHYHDPVSDQSAKEFWAILP